MMLFVVVRSLDCKLDSMALLVGEDQDDRDLAQRLKVYHGSALQDEGYDEIAVRLRTR